MTGLVILLKLDPNYWVFGLCDLKIWQMTQGSSSMLLEDFACHIHSHPWIQVGHINQKHSNRSQTVNSFSSCDLEIWQMTSSMQFQALWTILKPFVDSNWSYNPETLNSSRHWWFFVLCDFDIWWMTLKNNWTSFLCHSKHFASRHNHLWIETWVTVQKHPNRGKICFDLCDLYLWPLTLAFCMGITFVNSND